MNSNKIKNVQVQLDVVLGSATKTVEEISQLGAGSIIELSSIAGEPVKLIASGEVIGFGEVVVIDENFGLRVTRMIGEE